MQVRSTNLVRLEPGPIEYRLQRRGRDAVVVFHGGHMHAGLALGEEVFADLGHTVLAPSRPGYGRTPLGTATTPAGFADATRRLCDHLGIRHVAAVMGISAGGRTAVEMAARHGDIVRTLILRSALSSLDWPDRRTRLAGNVVFRYPIERVTWAGVRALLRWAPERGLRVMLGQLSTEPGRDVAGALSDTERAGLLRLFSRMSSGRGMINDMRPAPDVTSRVSQPSLVIASRRDAGVPFAHAEALAASMAELSSSKAPPTRTCSGSAPTSAGSPRPSPRS